MKLKAMIWLLLLVGWLLPVQAARSQTDNNPVVVAIRFEGALHPVMIEHLKRAQQMAERQGAQAIILELDTPGGSINLMNQLVEDIRSSDVPIIVYVSPRGAMAASAGTLITLAGHASAMAPETIIGAASPVGSQGEDIGETMALKEKEALKATVRTLANQRGQKAVGLAQEMIDDARAISVDEALEVGLVDYKAANLDELLREMDGREVIVHDKVVKLQTAGAQVVDLPQSFMEELLTVLANPNLVFILLSVGVQAILIEFWSPGGWVAGFVGVVCLLLAVYGMGLLPVNWFGILFMVLAFVLFILDVKALTHGALTAAGAASFIVGALVLFNSPNVPAFQRVSVPLVVGTGAALGLVFFTLVMFALRAHRQPVRMGRQTLIGQVGVVKRALSPTGTVQVGSELWSALLVEDGSPAPTGTKVQVVEMDNLQIRVKKVD